MKGQVSEEGIGSDAQVSDLNGRVHSWENTGGGAGCVWGCVAVTGMAEMPVLVLERLRCP